MSKIDEKLSVKWSKQQKDLKIYYPLGIQTNCDASYIFSDIFNKQFQEEMINRGYDLTTLKFEIYPKLPNKERFPGLSAKMENNKIATIKNRSISNH